LDLKIFWKNGFEKLEKEKGKEILFFSGRFLSRSPSPRPAAAARFHLLPSCAPLPLLGRAAAAGPASRPRVALSVQSLTMRVHLSDHLLPQAAAGISLSFLTVGESFSKSSSFLT
jgi:hypothetical protein